MKYKNNGSLVIGFNAEDRATVEELLDRGTKNGVEGLRVLEREEIVALEPNIGDGVTSALYAPTGAIVCPYELTVAAIGNAMDNGAELKTNFGVKDIKDNADCYEIISDNESIKVKVIQNDGRLETPTEKNDEALDDYQDRLRREFGKKSGDNEDNE